MQTPVCVVWMLRPVARAAAFALLVEALAVGDLVRVGAPVRGVLRAEVIGHDVGELFRRPRHVAPVAVGVMGALSSYSKGAPVRIIGAETTGAKDLFWYVRADSPIKSLKDTAGKTIAYSTKGSSTNGIVTAFMKQYDLKATPVATGSPSSTLTQVMSGQVDVGWSAPPFGLDQLDEHKIRIVASGNDADVFKGQTVRLLIANEQALQSKRDAFNRFMQAYRETINYMYTDPAALKVYAEFVGISEAKAKRTRDEFFPREAIDPDRIVGLEQIVKDAVDLKFTAQPLTNAQLAELVQIPPAK